MTEWRTNRKTKKHFRLSEDQKKKLTDLILSGEYKENTPQPKRGKFYGQRDVPQKLDAKEATQHFKETGALPLDENRRRIAELRERERTGQSIARVDVAKSERKAWLLALFKKGEITVAEFQQLMADTDAGLFSPPPSVVAESTVVDGVVAAAPIQGDFSGSLKIGIGRTAPIGKELSEALGIPLKRLRQLDKELKSEEEEPSLARKQLEASPERKAQKAESARRRRAAGRKN